MAAEAVHRKRVASVLFLGFLIDEFDENLPRKINRKLRDWRARREEKGVFHQIVKELQLEDHTAYRDFFRVNKD